MLRSQAFVFSLLLGLKLPKAKGNCNYTESQRHCVCSLEANNFIQCLPATTYELQGGNLEQFAGSSGIKPNSQIIDILEALLVRRLIFTDLIVPEVLLPGSLEFLSYTQVSELEFVNCTFLRAAHWSLRGRLDLKVSSLRFHKVTAAALDERLNMSRLRRWLETLQNLTVTESQVTSLPCEISKMFTVLRLLDVSGNKFQDQSMESTFCEGVFLQLQILKLRHNNLTSFETVCKSLGHLKMLTHLDLSQNNFQPRVFSSSSCTWPHSLHIFNLSNTGLEQINSSLPPNIEILDLSANNIFTLHLSLAGLKELYLSQNRLQTVPSLDKLPSLQVLSLDQNRISQLPSKQLERLQSLKAGHNLYNCSCSRDIQELAAKPSLLPDWPQDYTCDSPLNYQGSLVKNAHFSSLRCKALAEQEVRVQAAVGIRQIPGSLDKDSFLVVNKDSNRLIFISKADKGVQEGCLTIDGVFSLDTGQDKLFLDQLQPLLAMVPLGYNVSLLVCEAHHDGTQPQIQALVRKVIESVLQETSPAKNCTQYLQTITFVQIYTDGKAQDLLSPRSQVLQVMDLPPLGLMVEEATEVVVANSQAATHCYLQGTSLHQSYLQKPSQKQHEAAMLGGDQLGALQMI